MTARTRYSCQSRRVLHFGTISKIGVSRR
jgi:hypothetical protein